MSDSEDIYWSEPPLGLSPLNGVGVTPVPAVRSGMSRIFTESWAANRTAAAPGPWTAVVDGTHPIRAGVAGGQTILATAGSQSTRSRYCAAVEIPSAAQVAAGYNLTSCNYTIPGVFPANYFCLQYFLRPGHFDVVYNNIQLLCVRDAVGGNSLVYLTLDNQSRDGTYRLRGQVYGGAGQAFSVDLPCGEWVRIWYAWQRTGAMTIYYQLQGDIVRTIDTTQSSPSYPNQYYLQLFNQSTPASQPAYSGQIGSITMYDCDSIATARSGPTDWLWPNATGNTVVLQAGNANTYTTAGSYDHINNLLNRSVIMGPARNVKDAARTRQDWNAPGATTNSRDAFGVGVLAGGFFCGAAADTVRVIGVVKAEGEDWFGGRRSSAFGVNLVNGGGGELRCTETLANSWSANGTYAGVYQYTGATRVGGHPFGSSREEFAAIVGANLAAVGTLLSTYDYSAWVDTSGNLYCKSTGGRPTERSCTRPPDLTGMIVDGIKITGFAQYDYSATGGGRTNPTFSSQIQVGPWATILRNVELRGHSKHLLEITAGAVAKGLIVVSGCKFAGQSPRRDSGQDSNYSAQDGDFDALVIYVTPAGPGSMVLVVHRPDYSEYYAVPGSAVGAPNVTFGNSSPSGVFYGHGSEMTGTYGQVALVHFRFANSVPPNLFGVGIPPAAVDTTNALWQAFTADIG